MLQSSLRPTGNASVAELADAPDLGSGSRKGMGVRPSPFAPHIVVISRPDTPRVFLSAFINADTKFQMLSTDRGHLLLDLSLGRLQVHAYLDGLLQSKRDSVDVAGSAQGRCSMILASTSRAAFWAA